MENSYVLTLSAMDSGTAFIRGDVDNSAQILFSDIIVLISFWGPCSGCPADLNGNDAVEFGDLLAVLTAWGPCP